MSAQARVMHEIRSTKWMMLQRSGSREEHGPSHLALLGAIQLLHVLKDAISEATFRKRTDAHICSSIREKLQIF